MNGLYHDISLPGIRIPGNLFLAPIAGFSDAAFRSICMDHQASMCFSEMVSCDGIVRKGDKTISLMKRADNETRYAIQLFTSDPETAYKAVAETFKFNPDVIDLNCGCPVPKVVKNGAGSALMTDLVRLKEIVAALTGGISDAGRNIPVSVKIRSGWDSSNINFIEAAAAAVEGGASMVSIHARTKTQGYSGKADWEQIKKLKRSVAVPVIGSGDLFTAEAAAEMLDKTGCDGVMFSRGALGNPWIFCQTKGLLITGKMPEAPAENEKLSTALKHLELAAEIHGEEKACREMKKHLCSYTKGIEGAAALRNRIVHASALAEYREILNMEAY